jgi:hypothetical protein
MDEEFLEALSYSFVERLRKTTINLWRAKN